MVDLTKHTIAIVSHAAVLRDAIVKHLSGEGYEILSASSGREGSELIQKARPTVSIIEMVMPDMNGFEMLRRIEEINPETQVIMISGLASLEDGFKAAKMGAFAFLAKPLSIEQLLKTVGIAIASKPKLFPSGPNSIAVLMRGISDIMRSEDYIIGDGTEFKVMFADDAPKQIGVGEAAGKDSVTKAVQRAVAHPFITETHRNKAKSVLINIAGGDDLPLFQLDEAVQMVKEAVKGAVQMKYTVQSKKHMQHSARATLIIA